MIIMVLNDDEHYISKVEELSFDRRKRTVRLTRVNNLETEILNFEKVRLVIWYNLTSSGLKEADRCNCL